VGVFTTYFWMVLNCLTTAFYALIMRSKIKEVGFKDFDTVFYNNLLSIPVLLVASLFTEIGEYFRLQAKYSTPAYSQEFYGLMYSILLSSVSTFAISYGSSWCVRVTSSTTYR
jgi:GDP-mannose transporter